MSRPLLTLVVAVSGASVLAVEILGTRILGPFYGVSIFLWSALISVTLAALSLGYVMGGRWADRGTTAAGLSVMLGGAGLWLLAVPWLLRPILAATEPLGLRAAVLVAAVLLFFPPLAFLGMVGPYAIRMSADRLDVVGRSAGNVFAVSTVASVVAALATGFWLIPSVGVTRLTFGIAAVLLATALAAAFAGRHSVARVLVLVAGLALAALAFGRAHDDAASAAGGPHATTLRFVGQSPYAEIRVLDRDGLRYLLIDGGVHTIVRPGGWSPQQRYVIVTELLKPIFARPGDLLLVGLGGGSAARVFARGGWRVDAVEIDPVVARVAREHFGLDPEIARVHLMDGRRFLMTEARRFDIVLFDAFGSSSIPFHLVTDEVFALVERRLAPGGVFAINIETRGWHHPLTHALMATLAQRFETVWALPTIEPPDRVGNVILLASHRPLAVSDEDLGDPVATLSDDYEHWRVLQRIHAWDNRFGPEPGWGPVLTDDRNPADLWAEGINLAARRELHAFFGLRGGSW